MKRHGARSAPTADLKDLMAGIVRKVTAYNPQADVDKLWRAFRFAEAA